MPFFFFFFLDQRVDNCSIFLYNVLKFKNNTNQQIQKNESWILKLNIITSLNDLFMKNFQAPL